MPVPAFPVTPPMTPPSWSRAVSEERIDDLSPESELVFTPQTPLGQIASGLLPGGPDSVRKPSFSSSEASRKLTEVVDGTYGSSYITGHAGPYTPHSRRSSAESGEVVDLADDDEEVLSTSPPAYNKFPRTSAPQSQEVVPGSPFQLTRSLSNTGMHMTARGANYSPDSYFDKKLAGAKASNKGTYAVSDGALTPSQLESGSNDGSCPSTPTNRSGFAHFPLQLNLGMGLNFGVNMNFGNNKGKEVHSQAERDLADQKLNALQALRDEGAQKAKLSGFVGGGGNGVKHAGMKGSGVERKKSVGKFYRPSNSIDGPNTTAAAAVATVTRFFTRVPRKYRPLAVAALCFVIVGSLVFRWAGERALDVERAAARRHAMHMQKAFVIPDDSGVLAQHPSAHLASSQYVDPIDRSHAISAVESVAAAAQAGATGHVHDAPEFAMTKHEELAALISFFTSTSSNALPKIDPSKPLDPQLVLDFDYTKPSARADLAQLEADMWSMFPVVLVGNMRDPFHREVLKLLSTFKISPPPMIVEIDQRSDAEYLTPLLARLLDTTDLPQMILKGRAAGSFKEIIAQNDAGKFVEYISASGASIVQKKYKKKKHGLPKDAERADRERILAPQPVQPGED